MEYWSGGTPQQRVLKFQHPSTPILPHPGHPLTPVLRLPVNNELNVFRETAGDFRDDVALEKRNQFVPVGRTEHENVDAQRGGEIENGGGRVFADRVERDDLDAVLPAMIQHGAHDS